MSKLEDLKTKRDELEAEATRLAELEASKIFTVEIDDVKMIKTIQDHLNKGYTWTTKNAAIIVTLYDKLKTERTRITKEFAELETDQEVADYQPVLELKAYELNGLYQALLNVNGEGIENARKFIRMLTLVGESVTTAMTEMSESNKVMTDLHVELNDVDGTIQHLEDAENREEVEPTLTNEG
jgi:hypothetical protein